MVREKLYTQKTSDLLGNMARRLPFTPNGLTFLTLLVAIAALFFAIGGHPLLAAVAFLISACVDTLDGGLARLLNLSTKLGAFLDGVFDRFVDFFILYSFVFYDLPSVIIPFNHMMFSLVYFTLVPTFIVAYANHRGAVSDPEEKKVWRIMNRAEMMILYLIALAAIPFNAWVSSIILFTTLVLNLITALQTIYLAITKSDDKSTAFKFFR